MLNGFTFKGMTNKNIFSLSLVRGLQFFVGHRFHACFQRKSKSDEKAFFCAALNLLIT